MIAPGRLFVTGTDTGVGKTLVAGILAAAWRAHYWKPIQAGTGEAPDSETVAGWIGAERVLPEGYRLREPLSPNQAAAREGLRLDPERLHLPRVEGPLVVEGAGGLLVPINERFLMIDLILRLALPVLLVARSGLGTLNHTLLSIEALRARAIRPIGVVLNGSEHADNRRDIEHFGAVPVIGYLPRQYPVRPELFPQLCASWFAPDPGDGG